MATADALPRRLAGRAAARSRRGRAGGVEHGDTVYIQAAAAAAAAVRLEHSQRWRVQQQVGTFAQAAKRAPGASSQGPGGAQLQVDVDDGRQACSSGRSGGAALDASIT